MNIGHPNDPFCVQYHSSQETVLIVRENSKNWDCIDPFIESHNYVGERESVWVSSTTCVSVEARCSMYAVAYMCFSVKAKDNWQTQIKEEELGEWSQAGISRKWRLAKQDQRDCINNGAVLLFSYALALLLGPCFAQRKCHVFCVCVCVYCFGWRSCWKLGSNVKIYSVSERALISWYNNMPQTILVQLDNVI